MDPKLIQLEETLKKVGFQKDGQSLDRLVLQILPNPIPPGELGYPWQLKRWDLTRFKGAWFTEQLEVELNRTYFIKTFESLIQEKLPFVTIMEVEHDEKGFWVLTEFQRQGESIPPPGPNDLKTLKLAEHDRGVFGFHVSTLVENQQISINFSSYFAFGLINRQVYQEVPKICAQSLGFSPKLWRNSLFEISIALRDFILDCSAVKSNKQIFLRLFERLHPGRQFKTVFTEQHEWRIFLSSPGVTEFGLVLPPIEVMESRELAQKFRHIEESAVAGQYIEARQSLVKAMVEYPDSLYLLRRIAFISLLEGEAVSEPILHAMLKAEPENLLFLSVGLHSAQQKNQHETALERISLIGEVLSQEISRFEQIRSFEFVLPEILGDGWTSVDPKRAYLCYERVLEKRGDNTGILQKLVNIAQVLGDIAAEASLVKRLLKLVQDRGEMASQLIRLAQLLESRNLAEAISYAMKAWQMAPHRYITAEYASELLLRDAKPEKAITVLDETIRQLQSSRSKRKLAELELKVGEIWWLKLHRRDLAQERFKRAMKLHSTDIDFLHRLIAAYRSMDERALEIRIYERIFDLSIRKQIKDEIFKSVSVLVHYFQKEKNDPARRSHIYQTLIRYYILKPEELFDIIDLENIEIDWEQLFQSVERQVQSDKKIDAKMYYLLLGRIAIQKLNDRDLGALYYEKCIKLGKVEPAIYEFLEAYYSKKKDHRNRARILKIQLKESGSNSQSRIDLLRQLFYASESFDDPEVDHYALRILIEDRDSEPVKRRFLMYQSENHLVAMGRLLSTLLEEVREPSLKVYWLEYILDVLHECDSEGRFEIIQKNLQLLEVLHEDELSVYEKAVRYHQDNPDTRQLAVYIDRLISRNVMPQIDPQLVLRALSDEKASKGLFLIHLARQQEVDLGRLQDFQKAIAILSRFDEHRSTIIDAYCEIGEITLLKVDELQDFYNYCVRADKLSIFTKALTEQIKRLPEGILDLDIFNFIIKFLSQHQFEAELIVPVLMMSLENLEPNLRERLKLELFQTLPKKSRFFDAEFGFEFLNDAQNWDFSPRFKNMFSWLMGQPKNHHRLKQLSQETIRRISSLGDRKRLARLVDFLKQHGIATRQGSWMAFEHFASQGIIQKSQEQWCETLRQVLDVQDLRNLISETRFLLNGLNTSLQTEDFISYVVDEKIDASLDEDIRRELRLEYALGLFLSEKHPELAHQILSQHFQFDMDDSRSWVPLFFLQSSLEHHYELYDLLKFIIPRISDNKDLLKVYPVTLESLEKEFQKIATQLNLPENIPNYHKAADQGRDMISDTERNLKAQSRHAIARGERTEFHLRIGEDTQSHIHPVHDAEDTGFRIQEKTQISEMRQVAGESIYYKTSESVDDNETELPPPPPIAEGRPPPAVKLMTPNTPKSTPQNWRLIGASLLASDGATEQLLKERFDSKLEKHFAVQLVAIIEGKYSVLDRWDYKVWRKMEDYFYQPEKRLQPGEGVTLNAMKLPIVQALQAMRKVLETTFQHRFTLRGLTDSLNIKIDEFIRLRAHIPFTDTLILSSPLSFYQTQWSQKSYRIFHLPGLAAQIHFEYQQKVFYIDQEYYRSKPPHLLFHTLLHISKAVEKGYWKLTRLSPELDLMPIFHQLMILLQKHGSLAEQKILVDGEEYALQLISPVDLANLEHDLRNLKGLELADIKNALSDFQTQIMLDCTFETLDLVGIVETFAKIDLSKDEQASLDLLRDRQIRALLIHASKFNF
ncbi:MAG: tetratricopeptide repeat protein [Oligoflexus sp.]